MKNLLLNLLYNSNPYIDCSGKWINIVSVEKYGKNIILECLSVLDEDNKKKLLNHFEIKHDKQLMDNDLIGIEKLLQDGNTLKVVQIKLRDDGLWVSYTLTYKNSIPKKLTMPLHEYKSLYGNLYG